MKGVLYGSVFVFYTDQNTDPDTGFFLTLSDVIKKKFPTAKSLKMVGSLERTVHISYSSLMQKEAVLNVKVPVPIFQ